MSATPELTLHVVPPSHPSRAAAAALELKGLDYERVELRGGDHVVAAAVVTLAEYRAGRAAGHRGARREW